MQISDVGEQGADQERDRKRHQHRMDRVAGDARRALWKGARRGVDSVHCALLLCSIAATRLRQREVHQVALTGVAQFSNSEGSEMKIPIRSFQFTPDHRSSATIH